MGAVWCSIRARTIFRSGFTAGGFGGSYGGASPSRWRYITDLCLNNLLCLCCLRRPPLATVCCFVFLLCLDDDVQGPTYRATSSWPFTRTRRWTGSWRLLEEVSAGAYSMYPRSSSVSLVVDPAVPQSCLCFASLWWFFGACSAAYTVFFWDQPLFFFFVVFFVFFFVAGGGGGGE